MVTEVSPLIACQRWLDTTVIGLNLCPFAARPRAADRIRFTLCEASGFGDIYRAFLAELGAFVELEVEVAETGLFIVPNGLADFDTYLDMLDNAEAALDEAGLRGFIQVASFHPDYQFDGSDEDDPANYTNRSPYPMLHLIREEGLAAALESYPDPEQIPERNIAKLRELGLAEMRGRLRACRGEDEVELG